jgi:hypothetical protein
VSLKGVAGRVKDLEEATPCRRTNALLGGIHRQLRASSNPGIPNVQAGMDGEVVAFPEVGGLHHCYERRAARAHLIRLDALPASSGVAGQPSKLCPSYP